MRRELFINITFVTSVLCLSLGNPFLFQNAPAALTKLATSASASASRPSAPLTHIADLRKKEQKAEQLQSEKLTAEDIDASAGDDLSIEGGDDGNEASPTLLQKKIAKILRKIRFISSLARGPTANKTDEHLSTTTTKTTTDTNDTLTTTPDSESDIDSSEETTTERIKTFQKIIYPHSRYDAPFKVSFDVNEKIINRQETEDVHEQSQNVQNVEDTGRLGQIGVFFAEILGSIVGLIYGAAAHIGSGTNGSRHLE